MPHTEMMSPQRDSLGPQIGIVQEDRSTGTADILIFPKLHGNNNNNLYHVMEPSA